MRFLKDYEVDEIIKNSHEGANTNFLKASHSLWTRFGNYDKHPPFVHIFDDEYVSIIFATRSERTKYVNLYEIVTVQGHEGKGYGKAVWDSHAKYCIERGMERIKLSCTPSSIGFHKKNGLIFWAVDKQGSLRSDQPLEESIIKQNKLRTEAMLNPNLVIPNQKVCIKLKSEDIETLQLSNNKLMHTYQAIQEVGDCWFRKHLYK